MSLSRQKNLAFLFAVVTTCAFGGTGCGLCSEGFLGTGIGGTKCANCGTECTTKKNCNGCCRANCSSSGGIGDCQNDCKAKPALNSDGYEIEPQAILQSMVMNFTNDDGLSCYCDGENCYCPPRRGGGGGFNGGVGVCANGQVSAIMATIPLNIRDSMAISAPLTEWEASLYHSFSGEECFQLYVTLAALQPFEWQNVYRPVIEYYTFEIVALETLDENGVPYTAAITRMNDILNRMRWIRRFSYANHTELPDLPAEEPQLVMNALLSTLWAAFSHPDGPADLDAFIDSFNP